MCGIVGVVSKRNISKILVKCLEKMEYRGYDSAGLAIIDKKFSLIRLREVGKVQTLANKINKLSINGTTGIAHTRWATHGKPSKKNAHPHVSEYIAIVHNGVIENYRELRDELKKRKYIFTSETDSEVIAHLIHSEFQKTKTLLQVIRKITFQLKGTYGIAIVDSRFPELLVATKYRSPLVIGLGTEENFLASDQIALLNLTKNFIYLEDGDTAIITWRTVCIFNKEGIKVNRDIILSNLSNNIYKKGKYNHFMHKEIYEQPEAIENILINRLNKKNNIFFSEFDKNDINNLTKIENIKILACGSSYNAGMVARHWFESIVRVHCDVEIASEYCYRKFSCKKNTLLIILSQSGETADILNALRFSKNFSYLMVLSICNVISSSLVKESSCTIFTNAGIEIGVASTKSFTTQLTILLLFTAYLFKLKYNNSEIEKQIVYSLRLLPKEINNIFLKKDEIKLISENFIDKQNSIFLGRGIHFPIAVEGALKLKEISYIHAEAYPAGELKHGPLALVDESVPIIIVAPNDHLLGKLKSNIEEVNSRNGLIYIFTEKNTGFINKRNIKVISFPNIEKITSPIFYVIPLQLLSYYVALYKGKNIDQPRNLAKSVTVE